MSATALRPALRGSWATELAEMLLVRPEGAPVLEYGTLYQGDGVLLLEPDSMPGTRLAPSMYRVAAHLREHELTGTTDSADGHTHTLTLTFDLSLQAGDTVALMWIGRTPFVLGVKTDG